MARQAKKEKEHEWGVYLLRKHLTLDAKPRRLVEAVELGRRAEMYEIPVQFFPISPERVRRTSFVDGLISVAGIVWQRVAGPGRARELHAATPSSAVRQPETAAAEVAHGGSWRPTE